KPGPTLHQVDDREGNSFDQTQRPFVRLEDEDDEEGHDRIRHLRANIGKEADPSEPVNNARQLAALGNRLRRDISAGGGGFDRLGQSTERILFWWMVVSGW